MTGIPIETLVPGGIRPTDRLHVVTNDNTCSRCGVSIRDDEVPILLWAGEQGHCMYIFCNDCTGMGGHE